MTTLAIWIPLAITLIVAVRALVDRLTATPCAADDLACFLRRVDLRLIENLLDPEEEAKLRAALSTKAFRRLQRQRILAACEQVRRISHNATVLLQWGNREYSKVADKGRAQFDDKDQLVASIVESASHVKSGASWALFKLRFWRATLVQLWPFLPSPSLSDLREVYGRDLLQGYENLTSSAGQFLLGVSAGSYDQVMAAL